MSQEFLGGEEKKREEGKREREGDLYKFWKKSI